MKDIERRTVTVEMNIEKRADEPARIRGYAALFNSLSEDLGGFREQIAPGAFTEAVRSEDVVALWNHNTDYVLGRKSAGTLLLFEDKRGLAFEVIPPDTQFARDLMTSIERGDISGMSFGFSVRNRDGQSWERKEQGAIRTLKNVRLLDVSPVTFPAYTGTEVAVRSMQEWGEENEQPAPDYSLERRKLELLELEM